MGIDVPTEKIDIQVGKTAARFEDLAAYVEIDGTVGRGYSADECDDLPPQNEAQSGTHHDDVFARGAILAQPPEAGEHRRRALEVPVLAAALDGLDFGIFLHDLDQAVHCVRVEIVVVRDKLDVPSAYERKAFVHRVAFAPVWFRQEHRDDVGVFRRYSLRIIGGAAVDDDQFVLRGNEFTNVLESLAQIGSSIARHHEVTNAHIGVVHFYSPLSDGVRSMSRNFGIALVLLGWSQDAQTSWPKTTRWRISKEQG